VYQSKDASCTYAIPFSTSLLHQYSFPLLPIRTFFKLTFFTGDGYELSFWSSFEFHLAMITACIPTIKSLYVKTVRKILALVRGKSTTS
jgi:hypothetical protein